MGRFCPALVAAVILGSMVAMAQTPEAIEAGRKVFEAQKCVMCHQVAGKGNKLYPLDGIGKKMSDADLRKWLTSPAEMEARLATPPKLKMSARKLNLKPAETDALVAYLKSLP